MTQQDLATKKGRLEEARLNLARSSMTKPVWTGVSRGIYEVTLELEGAAPVEIELIEAVLIRQIDRLLQRVVDQNRRVLAAVAGSDAPRTLLEQAWLALEPVRRSGFEDNEYEVELPGERQVSYSITEWDASMLRRYVDLLDRVCAENHDVVARALSVEAAKRLPDPDPSPSVRCCQPKKKKVGEAA